jgi:formate dehydrogenase iron-sulfur subunit
VASGAPTSAAPASGRPPRRFGAFFLLLDEPETYRLPPDPVVPTRRAPEVWAATLGAASALVGGVATSFLRGRR